MVTQRVWWVWVGTRNTQVTVHVLVPYTSILNQFIVQESYKSNINNYLSIPVKSDREANVAALPLYFTISNCRTAFLVAITTRTIQAWYVLSLARGQGVEE